MRSSFSHGVGCWKSILSSLEVFKSFVHFEVRNGARVFFWHDTWCGDQPLKVLFPNLFRMTRLRDSMVHDFYLWYGTQYHWDITFTRSPNDWKEESIISLLTLLADLYAVGFLEGDDKIIWSLHSSGLFSVKSLCEKMLGSNHPIFPVKAIWKSKAATKACFLVLAATKGKVPTEIMLKRRNFSLDSRCVMCFHEEESVDTSLSVVNRSLHFGLWLFP